MTFILQIISFGLFVFVCMKWIWPPIMKTISDRQNEISESLNAAKGAMQDVELSKVNASKIIDDAKMQAQEIIDSAQKRRSQIVDEASEDAKQEKERILKAAQNEIEAERNKTKEELRKEVSSLALAGAKKIIEKNIDAKTNAALVDDLIKNL